MRWPRTLSVYVAREVALFSGLGLLAVGALLVSQQLLEHLDAVLTVGAVGGGWLRLLGLLAATLVAHALPIAFAFGTTLGLARLSAGHEILAMHSCGIGSAALLVPALLLAAAVGLASGWLADEVEPASRFAMRRLFADAALRGAIFRPGRFREADGRVIFAEDRDAQGAFHGVLIQDETQPDRPYLAVARTAVVDFDPVQRSLSLALRDGQIHLDPRMEEPERARVVHFDRFTYSFDALSLLRGRYDRRNTDELSSAQIREVVAQIERGVPLHGVRKSDRRLYDFEVERRRAALLAPTGLALAAVALGIGVRRGSRAVGIVGCALVVSAYYTLVVLAREGMRSALLTPALAAWAPVGLLLLLGALLYGRARRRPAA